MCRPIHTQWFVLICIARLYERRRYLSPLLTDDCLRKRDSRSIAIARLSSLELQTRLTPKIVAERERESKKYSVLPFSLHFTSVHFTSSPLVNSLTEKKSPRLSSIAIQSLAGQVFVFSLGSDSHANVIFSPGARNPLLPRYENSLANWTFFLHWSTMWSSSPLGWGSRSLPKIVGRWLSTEFQLRDSWDHRSSEFASNIFY